MDLVELAEAMQQGAAADSAEPIHWLPDVDTQLSTGVEVVEQLLLSLVQCPVSAMVVEVQLAAEVQEAPSEERPSVVPALLVEGR